MVNDQTEDLVRRYFKDHEYFGLAEESVLIFPQQTLPAVDFEGRVIIDSPGHLFLSPNGNGGIFSSIHSTGTLKRLTELGVKHINVQSTDNLLACHADPEAVGFHIKSQLTITSKYLAKRDPAEKVGVHVLKGGRPGVVEYGELPAELEARRDEHGQLVFGDAYVGMFVIRSEFIAQINTDKESLQRLNRMYHVALKKVPCLSAGTVTKPDKPNAVKFELFIFDLFSMADSMGVIEILREEEFAPIKNAEGEDSPESSRLLLSRLHKRWLEAAGLTFEGEPDGKTRLV